MSYSES
jgi:pyruvate dehydrogenase E2 component (dihydrolipoamide acetyltransferase)